MKHVRKTINQYNKTEENQPIIPNMAVANYG
jgi:hypothetical protein